MDRGVHGGESSRMAAFSGSMAECYTVKKIRCPLGLDEAKGRRARAREGVSIAGHSKWANIKRTKAKVDAQRGAVFTKMSREIIVAARHGGPHPEGNFRLRQAIERAKAAGVPNDNIKRAIAKGSGADGGDSLEELRYEGYGPGGVAVLIRALTDNRNRTAGDLRAVFTKFGGNLGETGCVGWMFDERGQILVPDEDGSVGEDELMLLALEAGALDVIRHEDAFEILTEPADLEKVQEAIASAGYPVGASEVADVPSNTQEITEAELAKKVLRMLERLDDLDDVQRVAANYDLAESLEAELSLV